MEKVKVLMIGTLPPELGSKNYGGVARVVWDLARTLHDHEVDIAVGGIGKYYRKFQTRKGINIYGIGFSLSSLVKSVKILFKKEINYSSFSLKNLVKLFYSVYFLLYLSKRISFEVLHVHHVINQIPVAAKLIGIDAQIVSTVHSYTSLINPVSEETEKKNINLQLSCVDYITHVSHHLKNMGLRKGIKWSCDDKVIYNGIEFLSPNIVTYSPHQICFVGSVTKNKGVITLINSLEYLNLSENITLNIIGEGDQLKVIESLRPKYQENIQMLGQLPREEVFRLMGESQLLVNPSRSESFGLVYLEALSVGTPVIGYHKMLMEFKNYLNIGEDRLQKWLIEFNHEEENTKSLASKIEQGLKVKSSENYFSEKRKIINQINKQFSWNKLAADYKAIYNEF